VVAVSISILCPNLKVKETNNMNDSISARSAGTVMIGDLQVNRLGFGAMRLTGEGIWGEPVDVEGCKQVLTSVFHR
jgi:hypothetical protein